MTTLTVASTHYTVEDSMTTTETTTCYKCGTPYPPGASGSGEHTAHDAQGKISELESEVKLLTERAATAVYKLADYEEELRKLRKYQQAQAQTSSEVASPQDSSRPATATEPLESPAASAPALSPKPPTPGRFASLLGARRTSSSPNTPTVATPARPPSVREAELQEALQRELEARQQAETKVNQMSGELEELSAQLFQQANEMVASERKARAKLEERVEVLEKRDGDKRKRLDRLEGAVRRIERVHGLLKGA